MDKLKQMPLWKKTALGILAFFFIIMIIGLASGSTQKGIEDGKNSAKQPASYEQPDKPAEKVPQTKLATIREITSIPDTYIFDPTTADSVMLDDNSEGPFRVVVNSTTATGCSYAKNQTYEAMRKLYTDPRVKDSIEQVTYTTTGYLVTSMGKSDADDLTKGDAWTGPTNFYKVYFDNGFEVSDRNQPIEKKTWVVSINSCK
jgi:hypothetical protein